MTDARRLLTGAQCRAARKLLGLSQEELSQKCGVYWETIQKFEGGRSATFPTESRIRTALESAGIEFTHDEPGVRLREDKAR